MLNLLCGMPADAHNRLRPWHLCGQEHKWHAYTASDNYWSSSTNEGNHDNAWNVNFYSGNQNNNDKDNSNYVRCVRAGE